MSTPNTGTTTAVPNVEKHPIESLLSQIRNAQLQNGLRHGAYDRYRRYCTRRLTRLRKSLHCTNKQLKKTKSALANASANAGGAGDGDGAGKNPFYVTPQIAPGNIKNLKYLWIPLLCAERAWSHGVQIKTENTTGDDRKRHHAHRKFVKAAHYASEFLTLCESFSSARNTKINASAPAPTPAAAAAIDLATLLEADAYTSWMHGVMNQESSLWDEAISSYTRSRFLFQALMHLTAIPEHSQVISIKLSEIDTSIRFCFYSFTKRIPQDIMEVVELYERKNTALFDTLRAKIESHRQQLDAAAAAVSEDKSRASSSSTSFEIEKIQFRGREVPIDQSHRHLRAAFTRAENLRAETASLIENSLVPSDMKDLERKYSELHTHFSEAVRLLNEDIKHHKDQSEEQRAATHFLHTYASYRVAESALRKRAIGAELLEAKFYDWRNKSCDTKIKRGRPGQVSAVKIVRAYDHLLQAVSELEQIPGIEEDTTLMTDLTRKTAIFKTKRCLFLAESFTESSLFAEALTMFGKFKELIAAAKKLGINVEGITQQMNAGRSIAHAELVSAEMAKQQALESGMKRLSISADEEPSKKGQQAEERLIPCPVQDLEFVPPKPVFFDIALNEIEYPDLAGVAPPSEEKKTQTPPPSVPAQPKPQPQPQQPQPQPPQQKEPTPGTPPSPAAAASTTTTTTTTVTQDQEKKGWFGKWF